MGYSVQVLRSAQIGQVARHSRCTRGSVHKYRQGLGSQGFTLIELMVVVAIVGVLASLAVYMFGGQQRKITAKSEVTAMFAEFKMRQEQYRLENGTYLSSSATNDEADPWPSTPGANGGRRTLQPFPANWTALNMAPDASSVYCAYVTVVGDGGDATTVGAIASSDFNFVPPATDWYYILAQCDMDQNTAVDSYYFQNSNDSNLYFINQGQ